MRKTLVRPDRFSLALLMAFVTLAAIFAWLLRLATTGVWWAATISAGMMVLFLPFLFYGVAYAILSPFGALNEMLDKKAVVPQSPFATDRMPEKLIELPPDVDQAH